MLTTKISPCTVGALYEGPRRQPARAAQNAGTNEEILLYNTIRHTPLSHCPQPAGHTTCIALYSMRVNYMYNAPPISYKARKAKAQDHEKRTKRKGAQSAQKKTIYIFIFFSFLLSKNSHQGRKFRTRGEKISPGEKISHRPFFLILGNRYIPTRPGLRLLLGKR